MNPRRQSGAACSGHLPQPMRTSKMNTKLLTALLTAASFAFVRAFGGN